MIEPAEPPYLFEVRGEQPHQLREDLNDAVNRAVTHAIQIGHYGVLVTQHSYGFYTVALSKDVPFGQTHEQRLTTSPHGIFS